MSGWHRWAGAIVVAIMGLTGCSSAAEPPDRSNPNAAPPGPTAGASSAGPTSGRPSDAEACRNDPLGCPVEAYGGPTAAQAAPTSGTDVSTSTYTVAQYVDYIVADADRYWVGWFAAYGLSEPLVNYEVIEPGEAAYQSLCTSPNGARLVTPHDYPNAYYCGLDSRTVNGTEWRGMIVLPATTFQKMWTGDIFGSQSKVTGDFAAAYLIAHEFGHHIADEFSLQSAALGRPMAARTGANNELLADCFAGSWISSAYAEGLLTDTDYLEAIEAAVAIGDKPGVVTNDPHGTPEERARALRIGAEYGANGYPAGTPAACSSTYWH